MKWTRTSYRTETSGDYTVTGHVGADGKPCYLAYIGQAAKARQLGHYDTAADAKSRCKEDSDG